MPEGRDRYIIVTGPDGVDHEFDTQDQRYRDLTPHAAQQLVGRMYGMRPGGAPIASNVWEDIQTGLTSGLGSLESSIGTTDFTDLGYRINEALNPGLAPAYEQVRQAHMREAAAPNDFQQYLINEGRRLTNAANARFSPNVTADVDRASAEGSGIGDWVRPGAVLALLSQSAPSMVPNIALSLLAPEAKVAQLAGAAGEGAQSGGQFADQVQQIIETEAYGSPESRQRLLSSPIMQQAMEDANGDYDRAVRIVEQRSMGSLGDVIGGAVALTGLVGINPSMLIRSVAGKQAILHSIFNLGTHGAAEAVDAAGRRSAADIARTVVGRGLQEGIGEELPQSAIEQIGQNAALQPTTPGLDLFQGVPQQMVQGAIGGAIPGAGFGGLEALGEHMAHGRANSELENRALNSAAANAARYDALGDTETPGAPPPPPPPVGPAAPAAPAPVLQAATGDQADEATSETDTPIARTADALELALDMHGPQRTSAIRDAIGSLHSALDESGLFTNDQLEDFVRMPPSVLLEAAREHQTAQAPVQAQDIPDTVPEPVASPPEEAKGLIEELMQTNNEVGSAIDDVATAPEDEHEDRFNEIDSAQQVIDKELQRALPPDSYKAMQERAAELQQQPHNLSDVEATYYAHDEALKALTGAAPQSVTPPDEQAAQREAAVAEAAAVTPPEEPPPAEDVASNLGLPPETAQALDSASTDNEYADTLRNGVLDKLRAAEESVANKEPVDGEEDPDVVAFRDAVRSSDIPPETYALLRDTIPDIPVDERGRPQWRDETGRQTVSNQTKDNWTTLNEAFREKSKQVKEEKAHAERVAASKARSERLAAERAAKQIEPTDNERQLRDIHKQVSEAEALNPNLVNDLRRAVNRVREDRGDIHTIKTSPGALLREAESLLGIERPIGPVAHKRANEEARILAENRKTAEEADKKARAKLEAEKAKEFHTPEEMAKEPVVTESTTMGHKVTTNAINEQDTAPKAGNAKDSVTANDLMISVMGDTKLFNKALKDYSLEQLTGLMEEAGLDATGKKRMAMTKALREAALKNFNELGQQAEAAIDSTTAAQMSEDADPYAVSTEVDGITPLELALVLKESGIEGVRNHLASFSGPTIVNEYSDVVDMPDRPKPYTPEAAIKYKTDIVEAVLKAIAPEAVARQEGATTTPPAAADQEIPPETDAVEESSAAPVEKVSKAKKGVPQAGNLIAIDPQTGDVAFIPPNRPKLVTDEDGNISVTGYDRSFIDPYEASNPPPAEFDKPADRAMGKQINEAIDGAYDESEAPERVDLYKQWLDRKALATAHAVVEASGVEMENFDPASRGEAYDAIIKALNSIKGVFNRARATAYVSQLTGINMESVVGDTRGFKEVEDFLNRSNSDLYHGLYMLGGKSQNGAQVLVSSPEARAAILERLTNDDYATHSVLVKSFKDVEALKTSGAGAEEIDRQQKMLRAQLELEVQSLQQLTADEQDEALQAIQADPNVPDEITDALIAGVSNNIGIDPDVYDGPDNGIHPIKTADYQNFKAALAKSVRQLADQFGLTDVTTRVVDHILDPHDRPIPANTAQGIAHANFIAIAMSDLEGKSLREATDIVLNRATHELIHAMSNMGLITPEEMKALQEFAKTHGVENGVVSPEAAETFQRVVLDNYSDFTSGMPRKLAKVIQREEAVAMALQNIEGVADPKMRGILGKMRKAIQATQRMLRMNGITDPSQLYTNAQDILARIQAGEMGRRSRDYVYGRQSSGLGAQAQLSATQFSALKNNLGMFMFGMGQNNQFKKFMNQVAKAKNLPEEKPYNPLRQTEVEKNFRQLTDGLNTENGPLQEIIHQTERMVDIRRKLAAIANDYSPHAQMLRDSFNKLLMDTQRYRSTLLDLAIMEGVLDHEAGAMVVTMGAMDKTWNEVTPEDFVNTYRQLYADGAGRMYMLGGKNGISKPLRKFMDSPSRNAWVHINQYDVYLRKSKRGKGHLVLDFASVQRTTDADHPGLSEELPPDQRQPRGKFSNLMNEVEAAARAYGMNGVYVENVLNPFLPEVLERYGFTKDEKSYPDSPPSYYKMFNESGSLYMLGGGRDMRPTPRTVMEGHFVPHAYDTGSRVTSWTDSVADVIGDKPLALGRLHHAIQKAGGDVIATVNINRAEKLYNELIGKANPSRHDFFKARELAWKANEALFKSHLLSIPEVFYGITRFNENFFEAEGHNAHLNWFYGIPHRFSVPEDNKVADSFTMDESSKDPGLFMLGAKRGSEEWLANYESRLLSRNKNVRESALEELQNDGELSADNAVALAERVLGGRVHKTKTSALSGIADRVRRITWDEDSLRIIAGRGGKPKSDDGLFMLGRPRSEFGSSIARDLVIDVVDGDPYERIAARYGFSETAIPTTVAKLKSTLRERIAATSLAEIAGRLNVTEDVLSAFLDSKRDNRGQRSLSIELGNKLLIDRNKYQIIQTYRGEVQRRLIYPEAMPKSQRQNITGNIRSLTQSVKRRYLQAREAGATREDAIAGITQQLSPIKQEVVRNIILDLDVGVQGGWPNAGLYILSGRGSNRLTRKDVPRPVVFANIETITEPSVVKWRNYVMAKGKSGARPAVAVRIVELSFSKSRRDGDYLSPTEIAAQMQREGFFKGKKIREAADLVDVRRSLLRSGARKNDESRSAPPINFPELRSREQIITNRRSSDWKRRSMLDEEAWTLHHQGDGTSVARRGGAKSGPLAGSGTGWTLARIAARQERSITDVSRGIKRHDARIEDIVREREEDARLAPLREFKMPTFPRLDYEARDIVLMFNEGLTDPEIEVELGVETESARGKGSVAGQSVSIRHAIRRAMAADGGVERLATAMSVDPAELTSFVKNAGKHRKKSILGEARRLVAEAEAGKNIDILSELKAWVSVNRIDEPSDQTIKVVISQARSALGVARQQQNRIDPDTFNAVVKLRRDGASLSEIANQTGISYREVNRVIARAKRMGEEFPRLNARRTADGLYMFGGPRPTVSAASETPEQRAARIKRRINKGAERTGARNPTLQGFAEADIPGLGYAGRSGKDIASQVIDRTPRGFTATTASRRTSIKIINQLVRWGRNLETHNPNLSALRSIGGWMKDSAYKMTALANLNGQGYFLSLRGLAAGWVSLGSEHVQRLSRLADTMTEEDFQQYMDYMTTRDADPNAIDDEDVRAAAVLSKALFDLYGEENTRIARLDPRQFEKYRGRYLPRKFFDTVAQSLTMTGMRLGSAGYLKQRLPGKDQQIFGALDLTKHTEEAEDLRQQLSALLDGASYDDIIGAGRFLSNKLKTTRGLISNVGSATIRAALPAIKARAKQMEDDIDAADLISAAPDFNATPSPSGRYPMKKRYGDHFVGGAIWRAARQGTSIGRVLERSTRDAQITDPVILSAAGIMEQNRDLAHWHFMNAMLEFQGALADKHKEDVMTHIMGGGSIDTAPDYQQLNWFYPQQLVNFEGRVMTSAALAQQAEIARKNLPLNQTDFMRKIATDRLARMDALVASHTIDPRYIGDQYIQLSPDNDAYGNFRGLIVHRGIANILTETMRPAQAKNWVQKGADRTLSFFKQAMTTLNPKGHARAIFQNASTLYFNGVGTHDLGAIGLTSINIGTWKKKFEALSMIENNDPMWKDFLASGGKFGTYSTTELRHAFGLVRRLQLKERIASGDKLAFVTGLKAFAGGVKEYGADMFNFWDTWARFTKYVDEIKDKGQAPGDAMNEAYEWSPDYTMIADGVRVLRNSVVPFACVDDQTEILTQRGWLKQNEVKEGDVAASYNMDTGRMQWSMIEGVYRAHKTGDMIHVQDRHLDMLMTPDHRCVVKPRQGKSYFTKLVQAKDLNTSHLIPTAADFDHQPVGEPMSDDMVELLAWYITEGHPHRKCNAITITQNAGPKADMIAALLHRMGAFNNVQTQSENEKLQSLKQFYVPVRLGMAVRELAPDKQLHPHVLMRMTKAQIGRLVGIMILGDGHIGADDGRACFVQKNNQTAATFQMALAIIGKSFNQLKKDGVDMLHITVREGRDYCVRRAKRDVVAYDGIIWCPKVVGTHTWLARRNGKPFITHNTYNYKLTPKLFDQANRIVGEFQRGNLARGMDLSIRFMAPVILWTNIMSFAAATLLGMSPREHDAFRRALSEFYRRNFGSIPLPWRDSQGHIMIIDLGVMHPWTQDLAALNALLRGDAVTAAVQLGVGNPILDIATVMKTGIDPYTGFPVYQESDTEAQKNMARLGYIADYFTPPMFRGVISGALAGAGGRADSWGSGELGRLADATVGDHITQSGKPIEELPYLFLRMFTGFNINVMEVNDQVRRTRGEINRDINAINEGVSTARRQMNRDIGAYDRLGLSAAQLETQTIARQEAFQRYQQNQNERLRELRRQLQLYNEQVEPIQDFEDAHGRGD